MPTSHLVDLQPGCLTLPVALQGADIYISSKLAMLELIMSGCTCSSDHLYIYPNDVCLEDSIRAARSAYTHP